MVVSSQHLASEAGVEILQAGGNAVDAAVAVGYALAVVNPCCGNIGGGGFMTLHLADGRDRFIDFREMAPAAATADMYLDAQGKVRPGRQPVWLRRRGRARHRRRVGGGPGALWHLAACHGDGARHPAGAPGLRVGARRYGYPRP